MKFTILEIEPLTLYVFYFILALVSWAIFYYTIKFAVKNGMLEAKNENPQITSNSRTSGKIPNSMQSNLQNKYDNGEISFEKYKTEWERLDSI